MVKTKGLIPFVKLCRLPSLIFLLFFISIRNLQILPNGEGIYKGQYFGIFLVQSDCGNRNPKEAAVYATYKLKILDQVNGKHSQGEGDPILPFIEKKNHNRRIFLAI